MPPATGARELAHHILHALGKTADQDKLAWARAGSLLEAERIHQLVLLRAHLLTYPALRRLADCADHAGTRLRLLATGEEPTQALRQLLEQRPHYRAAIAFLLDELAIDLVDRDDELPADHGPDFAELRAVVQRRTRVDVARGLRAARRAAVLTAYDDAYTWTREWAAEHETDSDQDAADALLGLAAHTSTASQTLTNAHAGLHAFTDHGWTIKPAALDDLQRDHWWELRPATHQQHHARAAQSGRPLRRPRRSRAHRPDPLPLRSAPAPRRAGLTRRSRRPDLPTRHRGAA